MSEGVIVTYEFAKNAKHLYRTALRAMTAWRTYTDARTIENATKVGRHFRLLRKALTRFHYGVGPLAKGGAK